ncbi:MAG: hypothetical protein D4R88_00425 [Methanosarcinales archaeon]|nr:MAG: hypothetical protein D4R88_00425 [Methanosarcinales archaeon]
MFEVLYIFDAGAFDRFEFILGTGRTHCSDDIRANGSVPQNVHFCINLTFRQDLQDRQDTICVVNPVDPV